MSFFQNTCKPKGFAGKVIVNTMNTGHSSMAKWGFEHIDVKSNDICLDIGCGGGANIKKLLKKSSLGKVMGIDYSDISVDKSKKVNKTEIEKNRCQIFQGDVMRLPFSDETFNLITAFETVYFWPDIDKAFEQVHRVLKSGGTFMICNELNGENSKDEKWTNIIKGMKIYTCEQLKDSLKSVGFTNFKIDKNQKGWLSVVCNKK